METIKSILVPTDFSGHSFEALRAAVRLCRKFKAELHLLHVHKELFHDSDEVRKKFPEYQKFVKNYEKNAKLRRFVIFVVPDKEVDNKVREYLKNIGKNYEVFVLP